MHIRITVFLLLLGMAVPAAAQVDAARAAAGQAEETVDSNQPEGTAPTPTASTTTEAGFATVQPAPPVWINLVRVAAVAGPIAFLILAWTIGAFVHFRLVRREQEQFPAMRGSRTPQTTPMVISALLFFVPVAAFIFFEIQSRREIRLGIGGINDEWQPVTSHAWTALVVCLVLALVPWLFAQRADTVARGRA